MPKPVIIISWENLVDLSAASLTAFQEMGQNSASNMANPIVGRRWRSNELTTWGQVDFGSNQSLGVLALRFPRDTPLPLSGNIRHYLDASGGTPGAGAVYDSTSISLGLSDGYGYHVHVLSATQTARYWRFNLDVSAAGISYLDIGRAWAGASWSPTHNMALGYKDLWEDLSTGYRNDRSGAEFIDERPRQRSYSFNLNALSESERDSVREGSRKAGTSKQILAVKDSDAWATETILGRMRQTPSLIHRHLPTFQAGMIIGESL